MLTREDAQRLALEAGFHPDWAIEKCLDQFQAFYSIAIAHFLERTGQYVTNDASREAVIAEAVAAERKKVAPLLVLLKKFDSIMDGCGNWPDTSTSQVNLGDLAAEVRDAIRKHEQKGGPIPDRLTFAGKHAVGGHSGHGGGLD